MQVFLKKNNKTQHKTHKNKTLQKKVKHNYFTFLPLFLYM